MKPYDKHIELLLVAKENLPLAEELEVGICSLLLVYDKEVSPLVYYDVKQYPFLKYKPDGETEGKLWFPTTKAGYQHRERILDEMIAHYQTLKEKA